MRTRGYKSVFEASDDQLTKEYRRLVSTIDPYELLARYGAENIGEVGRDGDQIRHSCLIDKVEPHHKNGDSNPSALLHAEKKLYICFGYGGGDIFWLLQKMEQKDRKGILPVLSELVGSKDETPEDFLGEVEKVLFSDGGSENIPSYSERIIEPWLIHHPYMYEFRGISPEVLEKYKIGYDKKDERIVLPHFWNGKLVGWQKRAIDTPAYPMTLPDVYGDLPKYKNSTDFPKRTTIFTGPEGMKRGSALVVEGLISVLKAETIRGEVPDMPDSVVSTFGAFVTNKQIELLKNYSEVYLWMDEDEPGLRATLRMIEKLEKYCRVLVVDGKGQEDDLAGQGVTEVAMRLNNSFPSVLAYNDVKERLDGISKG